MLKKQTKKTKNAVASPDRELAQFIREIPQIVPESLCETCRICCRFPETSGVQLPTWSKQEASWLDPTKTRPDWLKPDKESPSLLPELKSCGEGYRCPAFDPSSNRCTVHQDRPLDCRLYPFVLAQDPAGTQVVLAMDMKCPYLQEHGQEQETLAYAMKLAQLLQSPQGTKYLKANPQLAGPTWPEFVSCAPLPEAGTLLREAPRPLHPDLKPLTAQEVPALRTALKDRPHSTSVYTVASLLGWMDLIQMWWMELEGAFCLFSEQAGGLFMPVPPLGKPFSPSRARSAWEILHQANQGAGVSRIEGIEADEREQWIKAGFSLLKGESEYLYQRSDLANLKGEAYRSQRWAANRCQRERQIQFRPFRSSDLAHCLQLYTRWAIRRQQRDAEEPLSKRFVRDGLFFHRRLMMDPEGLGVLGWVAEESGEIRGYTFGAPISEKLFCILLEIADPGIQGMSAWLFRAFCQQLSPFDLINTMGDSQLPGLRENKRAYRPLKLIPMETAVRA